MTLEPDIVSAAISWAQDESERRLEPAGGDR
jgi:hypothetical protein